MVTLTGEIWKISSELRVSLKRHVWKIRGGSAGIYLGMTGTFNGDGKIIMCKGELFRDGTHWELNLDVIY